MLITGKLPATFVTGNLTTRTRTGQSPLHGTKF